LASPSNKFAGLPRPDLPHSDTGASIPGWHVICSPPTGVRKGRTKGQSVKIVIPSIDLKDQPVALGNSFHVVQLQREVAMKAFFGAMFGAAMLLAPASGAFAAGGYIQASSEEDQIVKEPNKPQLVTMASTDAAKGIKNVKGVVQLDQSGTYFTIVGVQVGSRGGTGLVRLWFQTNGKDVDNSNCEQLVAAPEFTTVMISQGVGEYKKGDKVNAMISGSAAGIGLVYKKPTGEPAVPSVIFSAWKID
jgi:hypothetical protein